VFTLARVKLMLHRAEGEVPTKLILEGWSRMVELIDDKLLGQGNGEGTRKEPSGKAPLHTTLGQTEKDKHWSLRLNAPKKRSEKKKKKNEGVIPSDVFQSCLQTVQQLHKPKNPILGKYMMPWETPGFF